ncbi:MAG: hypothetical protein LBM69_09850 [Lachnospiraceae bacterium]|jgi:hypothetical protein|nr:hypothetical protein [Lachnospiraceae bacterium]
MDDELAEKSIFMNKGFIKMCQGKPIIIYGAGNLGMKCYLYLQSKDLNIIGFAVTNGARNPSSVIDSKVYEVAQLLHYAQTAVVVVAMIKENDKVCDLLRQLGFSRIYCYTGERETKSTSEKHIEYASQYILVQHSTSSENDSKLNAFIDVREIFAKQNRFEEYNRLDIIVRYLAIEQYYGKNTVGYKLYERMQNERGQSDHNLDKFKTLIESWDKNGYQSIYEITLDQNLNLVDGSHRMALALYYKLDQIRCVVEDCTRSFYYGEKWFYEHGFSMADVDVIYSKYWELISLLNK